MKMTPVAVAFCGGIARDVPAQRSGLHGRPALASATGRDSPVQAAAPPGSRRRQRPAPFPPPTVLAVLNRANAAQIEAMRAEPIPVTTGGAVREMSSNWVSATYYVGAARLARVDRRRDTLKFLTEAAEHYNYALRGSRSARLMLNADEWAIGDLYEELYARRGQPGVIMPLRQRLDWSLPHLTRQPVPEHLVWWWSDALFMAPPVLARMSAQTGDKTYLDAMDTQWWRTFARLYDPDESLYFRDERFIERRDDKGRKLFWSRGNGWVMGGHGARAGVHAGRLRLASALSSRLPGHGQAGRRPAARRRPVGVQPDAAGPVPRGRDLGLGLLRLRPGLGDQSRRARPRDLPAPRREGLERRWRPKCCPTA
jgi:hypothetical protein